MPSPAFSPAESRAQSIFTERFSVSREPRSEEYRRGVLEALRFRLREITCLCCPYKIATAQADAWYAGTDEGHRIAREMEAGEGVAS